MKITKNIFPPKRIVEKGDTFSVSGCGKACISSMGTTPAMLRSDRLEITGLVMKTGSQERIESLDLKESEVSMTFTEVVKKMVTCRLRELGGSQDAGSRNLGPTILTTFRDCFCFSK